MGSSGRLWVLWVMKREREEEKACSWIENGQLNMSDESMRVSYEEYAQYLMVTLLRFKVQIKCLIWCTQNKKAYNPESRKEFVNKLLLPLLDPPDVDIHIDYNDFTFNIVKLMDIVLLKKEKGGSYVWPELDLTV